jgi:hypothetical protein
VIEELADGEPLRLVYAVSCDRDQPELCVMRPG